MAVSSTTSKVSYTATASQTTFAYTFKIYADADLKVYVNDILKTLTTDYTVTGAGVTTGGNIIFGSGLSASDVVVIERVLNLTQGTDYVENDPFPAETHEDALDRLTFIAQQHQDALDRTVKFATTVTDVGDVEVLGSATARASKLFAFDTAGDLDITQEIGIYKNSWSATTIYAVRDIVKDTGNNNIYICNTAHTSSGSLPISTNTDSAKWDLIVDAASASTSATNAAASATAAASSATAAAASETAAGTSETNAASSASTASTQATNAASSATSAASSATSAANDLASFQGQYKAGTSDPYSSKDVGDLWYDTTNKDLKVWNGTAWDTPVDDASASATSASSSASSASSSATSASGSATTATTKASEASTSATNASTSETNAAASATSAASSATAAQAAQTAAEAAADNFDDTYLGAKASDPTVDNDGDALNAGDLYFNTTSNEMKYYNGSAWTAIVTYTHPTGAGNEHLPATVSQTEAGYLDGVTSAIQTQLDGKEPADPTILKDADIGVNVQAYDADTAKTDVTQNYTKPQRSADTVDNDGSLDLNAAQNFTCTPTGNITLTFTNIPDGQSGTILLDNSGGHTISAHANTKVMGADFLTTVSTAGIYIVGYMSDGTNVRVYNSGVQQ